MISRKPNPFIPGASPKGSPLGAWLTELEERRQREFLRKTGLDYHIFLHHVLESLDLATAKCFIEINAGTGLIASHIARQLAPDVKIIGADIDQQELDAARLDAQSARLGLRVEWKKLTPGRFQFPSNSADIIACAPSATGVDIATLISESARILKESGCLVFASRPVASRETSLSRGLRAVSSRLRPASGDARQGSEKLATQLREAGFRQVVVRTTDSKSVENLGEFLLVKAVR